MTLEIDYGCLKETERPYSTIVDFSRPGETYVVDNMWGMKLDEADTSKCFICFVGTSDLPVIREKLVDRGYHIRPSFEGVRIIKLEINGYGNAQRVFVGGTYVVEFMKPVQFEIKSISPIEVENVIEDMDLVELLGSRLGKFS